MPQLDLYVAGFPCQSFSIAGNRKGFEETRGTLFFNVAEFIKENQPKIFILENVKGLLSHDNGKTFETIISILSDNGGTVNQQQSIPYYDDGLGYHIYHQVLNTKDFGIPQNRERVFIVGFKDFRTFSFPLPFPLKLKLKDILQDDVNEKYYLNEKTLKGLLKGQQNPQFTDGNDVARCFTAGGNSGGMHSSMTIVTSLNDKEYLNTIRTGGRGSITKKHNWDVIKIKSKKTGVLQLNESKESGGKQPFQQNMIYDVNGLSPALNSQLSVGGNIVNTAKMRRLTPLECWRLQAFPDDAFYKAKEVTSDTQLYKQAGNSISVNVMKLVIERILK